jgi:hypothetical protein
MFYRRHVENLSRNTIFKPPSVSNQNSLPTTLTFGSKTSTTVTQANVSSIANRELDSRIRLHTAK